MNEKLFPRGGVSLADPEYLSDPLEKEFSMLVFHPDRPVVEGELNLMQQVQNNRLRNVLRALFQRITFITRNEVVISDADYVRLAPVGSYTHLVYDGMVKTLGGFDLNSGAYVENGNRIPLTPYTSGTQIDWVAVELWFEEVRNPSGSDPVSTDVYRNGIYTGDLLTNDIKVDNVALHDETTRRVQLRARFRATTDSSITGTLTSGSTTYPYVSIGPTTSSSNDISISYEEGGVAGDGSEAAALELGTVDGYKYIINLLHVSRTDPSTGTATILPQIADTIDDINKILKDTIDRVAAVENTLDAGLTNVLRTATGFTVTLDDATPEFLVPAGIYLVKTDFTFGAGGSGERPRLRQRINGTTYEVSNYGDARLEVLFSDGIYTKLFINPTSVDTGFAGLAYLHKIAIAQ